MKNLEIIKHYQTIFSCEQFILTGSTALKLHGLVDSSSDIDIILIKPSEECINILEKLEEKSNLKKNYPSTNFFMFYHEGVKIDVFIENEKIECCTFDDILISPIKKIIDAKKKMARLKDIAQLRKIAASIITDKETLKFIDSKI